MPIEQLLGMGKVPVPSVAGTDKSLSYTNVALDGNLVGFQI